MFTTSHNQQASDSHYLLLLFHLDHLAYSLRMQPSSLAHFATEALICLSSTIP
jgi:hypothetical protein